VEVLAERGQSFALLSSTFAFGDDLLGGVSVG